MTKHYLPKPTGPSAGMTVTSPYVPGEDLGELAGVARMADRYAELAETTFSPSGRTVLIVRWAQATADHDGFEYLAVEADEMLCYSEAYGSLVADTQQSIAHWYDEDPA